MSNVLQNLTGKISFSDTAYTGDDGIDISVKKDGSVKAVVNGNDAIIYQEGGVKAFIDSSYAFYNYKCSAIDCTNLDTKNVINMRGIFSRCENLTSLNLSNFDIVNVTNMTSMFSGCSGLTSLDISNFNTAKVKKKTETFKNCSATVYVKNSDELSRLSADTDSAGCTFVIK